MKFFEGERVRFNHGPRKGREARVIARAAYSPAVDILTLRLDNGGVTYAHSDAVELAGDR